MQQATYPPSITLTISRLRNAAIACSVLDTFLSELAMTGSATSQTASRAESLDTIDAERCPTCNEDRFVMLRGNRVACPTCCSTIRRGELYVADENPKSLQTGRLIQFIALVIATGVLALWANGLLTLR